MSIVKKKKMSKEDFDRNMYYLGKPTEKLSLADTLYGETYRKQKEWEKERSALLQELGDNVGVKDILYSSNDDLKVIRDGLKSKNNYTSDVQSLDNTPSFLDMGTIEEAKKRYKDYFSLRYADKIQQARDLQAQREELQKQKEIDRQNAERNKKKAEDSDKLYAAIRENVNFAEIERSAVDNAQREKKEKQKRNFESRVNFWEFGIDSTNGESIIKKATSALGSAVAGKDAVRMLNLSEGVEDEKYVKDVVKLENFYDSKMSDFGGGELKKWMPYMEGKIKEQFRDFGYDMKEIGGYIFKQNSEPAKRIKESNDFKDFVRANVHNIVDDVKFSGRFKKPRHFPGNLFSAFGSVDFLVSGFDKDDNLKLYMFDTYDFNKNENSAAVEAGRRKMLDGTLKGFYTVHEILLSREELDRIMEGKQKRYPLGLLPEGILKGKNVKRT